MDEQQTPPRHPVRPGGSFPPGATPPTVTWTQQPTFTGSAEAPATIPDSGVRWPGRRTLERHERVLFWLGAAALAGLFGLALVIADWSRDPVLLGLAGIVALVAVGWLAASARARRPNRSMLHGPALRGLDRPTRRALVRQLRAGDPGPPALRRYAVAWTCQQLQAPWNPAILLALLASNTVIAANSPAPTWRLLPVILLFALDTWVVARWFAYRPGALRVADALERDTAPPPRSAGTA